jgi:arsenate reductase (thioredoxin)
MEKTTTDVKPLTVLFLCTGNSARSIMAESILNRLGTGKFKAYSAGSQPTGKVNPLALNLLRKTNYDVSKLRSKSWDEFATPDASKLDFVFTVCDDAANEVCPIWPGQPMTAHWGLPDPAKATGNDAERAFAFDDCFRMLTQRISIFVNLPIENLSKLSLQHHLDEIGRTRREAPSKETA